MTNNPNPSVFVLLSELGTLDGTIAKVSAEKKKIENDLKTRKDQLLGVETKKNTKSQSLKEKKIKYDREQKLLNEEREKLVERRKALQTLSNYKLQQAAGKEIEYAGKQLNQREEGLIATLSDLEAAEKEVNEITTAFTGLKDEFDVFELEAKETIGSMDGRLAEYLASREKIVVQIPDKSLLAQYNRIKDRHPANPLVPLKNRDSCSGCFMKVGPQVFVQLSQGQVVKCPGCGRILVLGEQAA